MTPPAIQVRNLVVERGGRTVLDGVGFTVETGSVTGLLGPSGSGKTTLMRCIVGVQKVKSGHVTVLGRPAGTAELRLQVGYLSQSPSVYADLTVEENVRHFAAIYGKSRREAVKSIEDVGLGPARKQFVRTLSGGQRSRASLACALLGDPKLLVLDEPTVGQDPLLRRELWRHFRGLADSGVTVLVSSHVMDEAARCDRILLVREGRIIADDTPGAIRSRPGSKTSRTRSCTWSRRSRRSRPPRPGGRCRTGSRGPS